MTYYTRRSLRIETICNWSQSLCAPKWQATIDGDNEPGRPIGLGDTEPEAVLDLYYEIELRDAGDDEELRAITEAGQL